MLVGLSAIAQTNTTYIRSRVTDSTTVNTPSGYGSIYYNEKAGKWQYVENGVKHNLTNPNLTTRQELIDSLLALEGRMVDSLEVHRLLLIDSISAVRETIDANYILISDSLAELRNDITYIENNYATIEQLSDSIGALEDRMVDSLEVHKFLLSNIQEQLNNKADLSGATFSGKVNLTADATNPGLNIGSYTGDPSNLLDGDIWYNSSSNIPRIRVNGATRTLAVLANNGVTRIPFFASGTSEAVLTTNSRLTFSPMNGLLTTLLLKVDGIAAPSSKYMVVVDSLGFLSSQEIPSGTVTSVGLSAPTGFSVSGSPVTSSGTLTLSYSEGYQGYTSTEANKLSGIASGATVGATWGTDLNSIPASVNALGELEDSEGWLHNDGEGVLTYSTPTASDVGAIPTSHTVNNISNGTGFLKNNGSGTWTYDNSTYLTTTQGGVMNRLAFFTGQAEITTNENLNFNPSTNQLQVPALQVNNINSDSSDNITLSAVGNVVFDPIPLQNDTLKRIAVLDQDGKLRWRDASTLGGFTNSAAANELMLSDGTNAIGSGIIRNADGQFRFGSESAFLEPGGANSDISLRARGNGNVTISTSEATSEANAHIRLRPGTGAVSDQRGAVIIQKRVISNSIVRPLRLFSDAAEGFTPGPGDGLGIEYRFDTNGAGNEEIAATIDVVSTDMTSGSEDFDMIFRTMTAGVGPTEKFRVTSAGNLQLQGGLSAPGSLGIGTTAPSYDFHLLRNTFSNVTAQLENDGSGQVEINLVRNGGTASSWNLYLKSGTTDLTLWSGSDLFTFSTAGVGTATNWASTSDIRLKNNIKYAPPQLEKVMRIANVVRNYDRTDTGENETGFIAQELVEVAPEYVNEGNDSTMWSVNYSKMVVPLYKAMAELQAEIEALKDELNKHKQCEH